MAEIHVIEIRAGQGEPALMELRSGVEVQPISVGTGGTWKISASGMRMVHAYLYFDGESLFLQTAEGASPVTVDGHAVPSEWTPIDPPCAITIAQAQLMYRKASAVDVADEEPTFAEAIPDPLERNPPTPPPPAPRARRGAAAQVRPFKRGEFAGPADNESTRLQPVSTDDFPAPDSHDATRVEAIAPRGALQQPPIPRDMNVRPAAGVPWDRSTNPARAPLHPPPAFASPPGVAIPASGAPGVVIPASGPQAAPPNVQFNPDEGDPTVFGALEAPVVNPYGSTHQFPVPPPPPGFAHPPASPQAGPMDGLLNVPPPSVPKPPMAEPLGARIKREWGEAPPLRKGLIAVFPLAFAGFLWVMFGGDPAPSSGAGATHAPSGSSSAVASSMPAARPQSPLSAAQDPAALPVIPSYAVPADPTPPHPSAVASAASPVPTGPDAGQASSDHRERQAADFVATHAYDQAIRLYDQLAIERPQNPAFREAARILRQKLDSGSP